MPYDGIKGKKTLKLVIGNKLAQKWKLMFKKLYLSFNYKYLSKIAKHLEDRGSTCCEDSASGEIKIKIKFLKQEH